MSRPIRLGLLVLLVAALLATPAVLIAVRADSGSAAFGDVERVGQNRISAARLDIEVGARSAPISVVDLAPGDIVGGQVELRNAGTLPLRYSLEATATTPDIAPHLTWWFAIAVEGVCPTESAWRAGPTDAIRFSGVDVAGGVDVLAIPSGETLPARTLAVAEADLVCLAVDFSVDAPNEAQGKTVGLELIARAEQLASDAGADEAGEESS